MQMLSIRRRCVILPISDGRVMQERHKAQGKRHKAEEKRQIQQQKYGEPMICKATLTQIVYGAGVEEEKSMSTFS